MFKYRGKSLDNEKWVYGDKMETGPYYHEGRQTLIAVDGGPYDYAGKFFFKVDPATVGVSWGMKDKNGKEVYTGMFIKSEALQNIKGKTSCSGTYWVPQLFKICFIKNAFVGVNQDKEIQYCGHVFRGGCVIDIPDVIEIIEEKPND